jgi:hypothetical protein
MVKQSTKTVPNTLIITMPADLARRAACGLAAPEGLSSHVARFDARTDHTLSRPTGLAAVVERTVSRRATLVLWTQHACALKCSNTWPISEDRGHFLSQCVGGSRV